jgi:hypothetical protein
MCDKKLEFISISFESEKKARDSLESVSSFKKKLEVLILKSSRRSRAFYTCKFAEKVYFCPGPTPSQARQAGSRTPSHRRMRQSYVPVPVPLFGESFSMLLQFGDSKDVAMAVPHIKKFCSAATSRQELSRVASSECYSSPRDALSTHHGNLNKFQPIVWKLNTIDHFGEKLHQVYQKDTPWNEKKDMAVFWGQLTGIRAYKKNLSDERN